ncbi:MAG: Na/Pi symporter, partial [Burkholderiales bacterium]|nr:Na/Pi symporter [Burkholderiales bacterium]
ANSTKTRLRGLASGIMVTALVQSSSAVTVATIGFVNAGLLNLSQALWVLFGTNVGTTMTGWLVALVGLQFKIEALALPLIGIGMILRLTGEHTRRSAFGMALAGFGVMFLGIDLLRETFSGLSTDFRMPEGNSALDTLVQVLIGMALTVLMQSSSAALAVALTAAQGGLLTAQGAAAVVIGANIGTTVKAIIAAIGATPPAKRAACAHILFNLLTGAVALLMLPWLIALIALIGDWLDIESSPAAQLALFHTVFNVLGIILIWPIAARMTRFLESRFRTAEEDEALPRYIDRTVLAVPTLALDALEREVRRMGSVALRAIRGPLDFSRRNAAVPAAELQVVIKLNRAISEFIVEINRAGMSGDSAERLPELLRATRYYEVVGELAAEAATASSEASSNAAMSLSETVIAAFQETSTALLATVDPLDEKVAAADREAALRT